MDKKHTSNVAKVHYQKRQSRQVAFEAMDCMDKLIKNSQVSSDGNVEGKEV